MLRFIAEWHGYLYSISDEGLWLHHYGAGTLEETLADGMPVRVIQETRYPWEGEIELTLEMPAPADFTFRLRIPEWVEEAYLLLNDRPLDVDAVPGSYARIRRTWLPGDRLCLILPMEPCLIEAHPRVEQLRGQAVTRADPSANLRRRRACASRRCGSPPMRAGPLAIAPISWGASPPWTARRSACPRAIGEAGSTGLCSGNPSAFRSASSLTTPGPTVGCPR